MATPKNLKKVTNAKQFGKLVEIMEENANIARGFIGSEKTKKEYGQMWKNFAIILNNYGPPVRDAEGWLKVWNDLKNKVKKKIDLKEKEIKTTDSAPSKILSLSVLEETVERLLKQQTLIPCSNTFDLENTVSESFSISETNKISDTTPRTRTTARSTISRASTISNLSSISTRKYKRKTNEKIELLKKQTNYMKLMKENSKEILELKKKKFKVYETYIDTKTELLKKKIMSEIQLIELNILQAKKTYLNNLSKNYNE